MQVPPEVLDKAAIQANSYLEALGALVADWTGIHLKSLNPATRGMLAKLSTGIPTAIAIPTIQAICQFYNCTHQ